MTDDYYDCRLCQTSTPHIFFCRDCSRMYCKEHIDHEEHYCGSSVYGAALPNGSRYYFPVNGWRANLVSRASGNGLLGSFASLLLSSPVTLFLLSLITVWFAVQVWMLHALGGVEQGEPPDAWITLFTLNVENAHYIWPWFTSMISHWPLPHLFINALVLSMFGPLVENRLGSRRFAVFFVVAGVLAAAGQLAVSSLVGVYIPMLGASGAIAGVLGAHAVFEPDSKVWFFFIVPMSMFTAIAALTVGSYAIVLLWGVGAGGIAHTAHAVGATAGLAYGLHRDPTSFRSHLSGVAQYWRRRLPISA